MTLGCRKKGRGNAPAARDFFISRIFDVLSFLVKKLTELLDFFNSLPEGRGRINEYAQGTQLLPVVQDGWTP